MAASKSNVEIQSIFGRILAGEVFRPGSFAPITLEVLARLDQGSAKMFEQLANMAIITDGQWDTLVTSVIGEDGSNQELLNRGVLMHLESAGLITTIGVQSINPEGFAKLPPSTLGGQKVLMSACAISPQPGAPFLLRKGGLAYLTQAGGQLQSIIPKTFDPKFAKRLRDGMRRIGVELTFLDVDIDSPSEQSESKEQSA